MLATEATKPGAGPEVLDRALACLTPAEAPQIRSHAFPSAAALAQPVREEVA
jgi:hypothetical protein